MKKMTMKQWHNSPADKKMDKKLKLKPGTASHRAQDWKAINAINAKRGYKAHAI
jgi:hypothetical protein